MFLDMCIYASCYEKNFRLPCLRQRYVCTQCMQYYFVTISEPTSPASQAAAIGGGVGGSVVAIAVLVGVILFITIR